MFGATLYIGRGDMSVIERQVFFHVTPLGMR